MMRACVSIVIRQICSGVDVPGGLTSIPIAHSSAIFLAYNFQSGASEHFLACQVYMYHLVIDDFWFFLGVGLAMNSYPILSPVLLSRGAALVIVPRGSAYLALRPAHTNANVTYGLLEFQLSTGIHSSKSMIG